MYNQNLLNVEERNAMFPDTFEILESDFRQNLEVGSYAQICLEAEGENGERFWTQITQRETVDGLIVYKATVENDLIIYNLPIHSFVSFGPEHVLKVMA
ncbi:hypothetical protein EVB55_112 [Rhizobium phage RHph_Y68]|uniref:Uncharacterized protein n=1 Tax=Rhizobium phage RHph_Y68 TaxID=2509787 RepID=A0A7S5QY76_9CAUD|nr:hypothetical protein PP934_gp112 [Rhizobium phage RHph_Y68]QIG68047.1 hypothetical protein EVB55_112 [Rhizobium phage RHph_Y68]